MGAEYLHDQRNRGKYLQESYTTMVRAIQSEWIFIQSTTKNMVDMFAGVEKITRKCFLPHLLFGKSKALSLILGALYGVVPALDEKNYPVDITITP